jgi:hypothetical protein
MQPCHPLVIQVAADEVGDCCEFPSMKCSAEDYHGYRRLLNI